MRVLLTSRLYPSSACPARGTFVHNQARFLAARVQLRVVSPTPWFPPLPGMGKWSAYGRIGRTEDHDGLQIRYPRYLSLPRRVLFTQAWRLYLAALERAAGDCPDLVHAHLAYPDGYAAARLADRWRVPLVISVHGHDVREIPDADPAWRALVTTALRRADRVICSSQDTQRRVSDLGCSPGRVRFVAQGVDCRLFRPGPRRTAGAAGWRLLYVGRFDERKGLRVLLESLALLRQSRPDVTLQLVGGSPVSGGEAAFRQLAGHLGVQDHVEFVREVPWEQIPARLAAADILVLPSFYDSFGIVLIEAMACGRPVVATRCGGPEEIVTPETGVLVEPKDAVDLARGLEAAIREYDRFDLGAIRRRAEQQYDYPRLAAQIAAVYAELVPGAAPR